MMGFSNPKAAMASIFTLPNFVCAGKAIVTATPFAPAENLFKQAAFSSAISTSATSTWTLRVLGALYFLGSIRKRTLLLLSFTFTLISGGNAAEIARKQIKVTPSLPDPMPILEFKGVVPGAISSSGVSEVTIGWLSALLFAFILFGFLEYNGHPRFLRCLIFPTMLAFAALAYAQNSQETLQVDTSPPPMIRAYKGIVPGTSSQEEISEGLVAWLFGLFLVFVLTALTDMDQLFAMPRILPIFTLLSVGAMAYANNITTLNTVLIQVQEPLVSYATAYQIAKWSILLGIAIWMDLNLNLLIISLFWLATIPLVFAKGPKTWIGIDGIPGNGTYINGTNVTEAIIIIFNSAASQIFPTTGGLWIIAAFWALWVAVWALFLYQLANLLIVPFPQYINC